MIIHIDMFSTVLESMQLNIFLQNENVRLYCKEPNLARILSWSLINV